MEHAEYDGRRIESETGEPISPTEGVRRLLKPTLDERGITFGRSRQRRAWLQEPVGNHVDIVETPKLLRQPELEITILEKAENYDGRTYDKEFKYKISPANKVHVTVTKHPGAYELQDDQLGPILKTVAYDEVAWTVHEEASGRAHDDAVAELFHRISQAF